RVITEYIIRGIVEQTNVTCTTHLAELAQPILGRYLAGRIVRIVHHDEVGVWGNIRGSKAERISRMQRQSIVVHERMITTPVCRRGIPWAGRRSNRQALLGTATGQGHQTEDGLDPGNG